MTILLLLMEPLSVNFNQRILFKTRNTLTDWRLHMLGMFKLQNRPIGTLYLFLPSNRRPRKNWLMDPFAWHSTTYQLCISFSQKHICLLVPLSEPFDVASSTQWKNVTNKNCHNTLDINHFASNFRWRLYALSSQ